MRNCFSSAAETVDSAVSNGSCEFLRLDQSYQDEFEKHEEALSTKDGWEVSKMHQQIIKSLPTYSSLMSR